MLFALIVMSYLLFFVCCRNRFVTIFADNNVQKFSVKIVTFENQNNGK